MASASSRARLRSATPAFFASTSCSSLTVRDVWRACTCGRSSCAWWCAWPCSWSWSDACACPWSVVSPHPHVAHISHHLDFPDPQVLTARQVDDLAAARAPAQRVGDIDLRGAARAPAAGRNVHDLERGALQRGSLTAQIEAEGHGVGHDPRPPPDLQDHTPDPRRPHALGDGADDALRDRELVHAAYLRAAPRSRRSPSIATPPDSSCCSGSPARPFEAPARSPITN